MTRSYDPMISIIVISYNTCQMTLECLESVFTETTIPFELIVVDNASTDGSAAAIAQRFPSDTYPNLMLLAENTNHGFAVGHNVALPHASAPWLLLLNPDTLILESAIDRLLAFAERCPEAGIWGGRTVFGDGTLNPASCWRRMTLWSTFSMVTGLSSVFPKSEFFNSEAYGKWQRDSEREVDIVTGCFFLIRRTDWDALGGFDPAFVMYGEEADLCLRAKRRGFKPMICPDATIIHYGGASEKVRADKLVRLMRAKIELIKRHFPAGTRRLGRWLFGLWPLSRVIVNGLAGSATKRITYREKALVWREVWNRNSEWRGGF